MARSAGILSPRPARFRCLAVHHLGPVFFVARYEWEISWVGHEGDLHMKVRYRYDLLALPNGSPPIAIDLLSPFLYP